MELYCTMGATVDASILGMSAFLCLYMYIYRMYACILILCLPGLVF